MMKNRRYLVLGILLVAAVGWVAWEALRQPPQTPEPVYDGHPLSYWIREPPGTLRYTSDGPWLFPEVPTQLLNDSNAVPFLIKALERGRWFGAAYYSKWLWLKLPSAIQHRLPSPNGNANAREGAAAALAKMGTNAKPAIPALIQAMKKDQVFLVRRESAWALGHLGRGDRNATAALCEALKDKESFVRAAAVHALGDLGNGDRTAVAALAEAPKDKDAAVRSAATNALRQLDPEAGAKAGVKGPGP
jgi:HEAT repeat protein